MNAHHMAIEVWDDDGPLMQLQFTFDVNRLNETEVIHNDGCSNAGLRCRERIIRTGCWRRRIRWRGRRWSWRCWRRRGALEAVRDLAVAGAGGGSDPASSKIGTSGNQMDPKVNTTKKPR